MSRNLFGSTLLFVLLWVATSAVADPCIVPDSGGGTVDLPPAGCAYLSPNELHVIINGLPPGTQINVDPIHQEFFNVNRVPGGNLGGEIETFDSVLLLQMTGTGLLNGFTRSIGMLVNCEVHTGPRTAGDPIQNFPTEMVRIDGAIFGDPDFDTLNIQGGSQFGLPSPGQTTTTLLPGGNWNVDSFFDISYRIDFQGAPGSVLEGLGGLTQNSVGMQSGEPAPPAPACVVPDNGTGTVDLPPAGCGYVSPTDLHMMIDGLPAGTTINVSAEHAEFFNVNTFPGGNLGGEVEQFSSFLNMTMTGTGALAGFVRNISMPIASEAHTGPRNPGDAVQTFPNDMFSLQGEIFGDPDFDFLRIEGGTGFGLPSPGQTTLTELPTGNFNVDSFFDVSYRIEFQGAPGSVLEGMAGTTQANVPMQAGAPTAGCSPIPAGTDIFPSTAKLVIQLDSFPEPFIVRLSSADLPDTIVERQPQVGSEADAEITQLELGGFSGQLAGGVEVRAGSLFGLPPSVGRLTNIVQDPVSCELISADSFFDVWVEITIPGLGQTWETTAPVHLERKITRLPPEDEPYEIPFVDPVPIVNQADGTSVGQIRYTVHHADPPFPPPGPDCFDTFLALQLNLPPLGFFGSLGMFGPTTVERMTPFASGTCSSSTQPCSADADCPLGEVCVLTQNIVETEMVDMALAGFDPLLGPIEVRVQPGQQSPGQLISQNPAHGTYAADSFFDVFVEIEVQGQLFHNDQPVPVQAGFNGPSVGVRNIPPDQQTPFQSPPGLSIPLLAEDGQPVGEMSDILHFIDTPRDWAPPPPPEDYCFDSWVHLELTIFNPFCQEELWLDGDFRILRDAAVTDASGQDLLATLMAKARFDGDSQCAGAVSVGLNPDFVSSGEVTSLAPAELFPADSFFDVYVEIDTGIGTLETQDPSRMTTTINNLPPDDGEIYFGPGTVIPLYDDQGTQIGEILEVHHEVHDTIFCPADCRSVIRFLNKVEMDVGIPGSGGGVLYDVYSGPLALVSIYNGGVIQNAGPRVVLTAPVGTGGGLYFLARARFGGFADTWSSLGAGESPLRISALP